MEFRDRRSKSGWEDARRCCMVSKVPMQRGAPTSASPEHLSQTEDRDERDDDTAARRPYAAAMRRAFELAEQGPVTGGNPQVGCVLLDADGVTVAEGWHRGAGTPHAECDAMSKLPALGRAHADGSPDASGLTAVVTLEPCNHTGRTGPCSEALLAAGIERVVYAISDPGHRSGGGGAAPARRRRRRRSRACSPTRPRSSSTSG